MLWAAISTGGLFRRKENAPPPLTRKRGVEHHMPSWLMNFVLR